MTKSVDGKPVVLVTGGAGYIGSHVCRALDGAGYFPVSYDSMIHGHAWAVNWGPLEIGDVTDGARLREVLDTWGPVAVVHMAAFINVGESVEKPDMYRANNVGGTRSLLDAMADRDIDKIVFSSTAAVYGMPESVPLREDHPNKPINPYGENKLESEIMMRDRAATHGLAHVALRYFNAAGAAPDALVGEAHDPETHLIPIVLDAAMGRRANIAIFGDDYDTPDGTCIRDYIHVVDLAAAHVLALDRLRAGGGSAAFNLGTGTGFSVRQVIDAAARVTGRDIPERMGPRRAGDPSVLVADPGRAMSELGWRPQCSDLETQVADAWRWHRKHFA